MFTKKKKQYYSKVLGLKTAAEFEEFAKRLLYYLNKEKLTKNRIMSSFFILLEIQKEAHSNSNLINFAGIKNQYIKKYANEILEQRKKNAGSQFIVSYLYENHRVKVSRGTIEKFYKQNGL